MGCREGRGINAPKEDILQEGNTDFLGVTPPHTERFSPVGPNYCRTGLLSKTATWLFHLNIAFLRGSIERKEPRKDTKNSNHSGSKIHRAGMLLSGKHSEEKGLSFNLAK